MINNNDNQQRNIPFFVWWEDFKHSSFNVWIWSKVSDNREVLNDFGISRRIYLYLWKKMEWGQEYCLSTAELFVRLYPLYHMPQALHKVLIHSHQVVRAKPLPIGMLSEEAQEASNKNVTRFRENLQVFTRKTSRKDTNCYLMRRMLYSSDPVISSLRMSADNKKELELAEEAAELLL